MERAGEGSEIAGEAEAVERVGAAKTGAACLFGRKPDEVCSRLWTG